MVGSFAVLTQRGPFSRNLLSYDLDSVEDSPESGTWYLVPFAHDIAPALLVSTSTPAQNRTDVVPFPVLCRCCAHGVYPDLGPDIGDFQRSLEQQVLGWDDALSIVRFLQSAQRHDCSHACLTTPEPALLLRNLQAMAARDAAFAARTDAVRQLLLDNSVQDRFAASLRALSVPTRRSMYERGLIVDSRLAGTQQYEAGAADAGQRPQLLIGSFSERAACIRSAVKNVISDGGSVVLIVSSDVLGLLYENMLRDEWEVPVVRWPTGATRKFHEARKPTVWISTRQFSAAFLPEVALVVADLGVPGEWPFFWQRFSLKSLVNVVADIGQIRHFPCFVGVSAPTLSVLDACSIPLESMPQPVQQPQPVQLSFVLRSSDDAHSGREPTPSGILLSQTMHMLRKTYDHGASSVLLLNIRGLATLIECAECGYTATCPECGATLTLGADRTRLFCKQCGHSEVAPDVCPHCHGIQLRSRGYGLDRLARELKRTFPASSVIPVDSDDKAVTAASRGPSVFLGTYADVQYIPWLRPGLVVFPDVSVGLRHPVFDNVEQLVAVVRGAAAETSPGMVLVQLDRRSLNLRDILGADSMKTFLETEQEQRRELMMPPFSRQFVMRLPIRMSMPDLAGIKQSLAAALAVEGISTHGLHADLLTTAQSKAVSLEFRVEDRQAALGTRIETVLSQNRLFQNASIRVY